MNTDKKNFEYLIINPNKGELTSEVIKDDNLPLVSFCIPTKNNETTIEKCLKSIISQNYPNVEIIIVDGYSSDKTPLLVKRFTNNLFFDKGKLGSARQKSIDLSNGAIIALFDSDIIIPHNNWLLNAVSFFNYSHNVSTIWPKNVAPPESSLITKLYFNFWNISIGNRIKTGKGLFGGGNSLFLKRALDKIEMDQNMHWGEDFDLAKKLKEKEYSVIFISDPLYHDTMRTLKEFYRKQFTGAQTFVPQGFGLMGLSLKDVLYEQTILGFSAMIRGIVIKRDISWFLYPFLLFARILAYSHTKITKRQKI